MQLGLLGMDSVRCPNCDTTYTGDNCGTCNYPDDEPEFDVERWFKCNPRSVHELLRKFGMGWRDQLPDGIHWGVGSGGRCYYWLPPERASKPFEKKLGTLDLQCMGELT